jgi:hypothetical protein
LDAGIALLPTRSKIENEDEDDDEDDWRGAYTALNTNDPKAGCIACGQGIFQNSFFRSPGWR